MGIVLCALQSWDPWAVPFQGGSVPFPGLSHSLGCPYPIPRLALSHSQGAFPHSHSPHSGRCCSPPISVPKEPLEQSPEQEGALGPPGLSCPCFPVPHSRSQGRQELGNLWITVFSPSFILFCECSEAGECQCVSVGCVGAPGAGGKIRNGERGLFPQVSPQRCKYLPCISCL